MRSVRVDVGAFVGDVADYTPLRRLAGESDGLKWSYRLPRYLRPETNSIIITGTRGRHRYTYFAGARRSRARARARSPR